MAGKMHGATPATKNTTTSPIARDGSNQKMSDNKGNVNIDSKTGSAVGREGMAQPCNIIFPIGKPG